MNPFITVAIGIALATVGTVTVPGWITQAYDAQATGDLARVAAAQSATLTMAGEYAGELGEQGATSFKWPIVWNTVNAMNVRQMFDGASSMTADLSAWDFDGVAFWVDWRKGAPLSGWPAGY